MPPTIILLPLLTTHTTHIPYQARTGQRAGTAVARRRRPSWSCLTTTSRRASTHPPRLGTASTVRQGPFFLKEKIHDRTYALSLHLLFSLNAGFLLPGSYSSAYDQEPWVEELKRTIRSVCPFVSLLACFLCMPPKLTFVNTKQHSELHAREARMVGVCFGHQILAESLGGKVSEMMTRHTHLHAYIYRPSPDSCLFISLARPPRSPGTPRATRSAAASSPPRRTRRSRARRPALPPCTIPTATL